MLVRQPGSKEGSQPFPLLPTSSSSPGPLVFSSDLESMPPGPPFPRPLSWKHSAGTAVTSLPPLHPHPPEQQNHHSLKTSDKATPLQKSAMFPIAFRISTKLLGKIKLLLRVHKFLHNPPLPMSSASWEATLLLPAGLQRHWAPSCRALPKVPTPPSPQPPSVS